MRRLTVVAALNVVLGTAACHHDRASTPTEVEGVPSQASFETAEPSAGPSEVRAARPVAEPDVRRAYAAVDPAIRNSQLWRNASWAGVIHTAMMDEFAGNRRAWLTADRRGQCNLLLGVTHKYLGEIQRDYGSFRGRDRQTIARELVRRQPECSGATPLSILGIGNAVSFAALSYSSDDGEPVTGAYEPYLAQIDAAVNNNWTTSSIASAINSVLVSAQGIPDPDLQLVYAAASLALESTYYWYDYEAGGGWSGGGGGGGGDVPIIMEMQAYSMFGAAMQKSWRTGAAVDVASCGIAVADKLWLGAGGPVGWKILGGACALYGGGGSLIYAIS